MKKSNKKGFTLIELIVVIAVLGILVLLAAPKFLGYGEKAKLAQIKTDIKSYETAIGAELIHDEDYTSDWDKVAKTSLEEQRDENSLFNVRGPVEENYEFDGEYLLVEDNLIKTKLKGDFYLGSGGEVYYHEDGLKIKDEEENSSTSGIPETTYPETEENDGSEEVVVEPEPEDPQVEESTPVEPEPEKEKVYEATVADFKWNVASGWTEENHSYNAVGKTGLGYYTYTGPTEDAVKIPNEIGGTPVTSYYKMFMLSDVKKVISDNPNVKSAAEMFIASTASSIDVSELNTTGIEDMQYMFANTKATSINFGKNFDTSNVKNMASMFDGSSATELDLSTFDTSKVTYMYAMFSTAKATSIDFGKNFDTSNVTSMGIMFQASNVENLDLRHFDTSKVTSMSSMFSNAKSKTINVSSFNTSNVTESNRMFFNALNLQSLDLSSFNTSGITNIQDMFSYMTLRTVYVKSTADVTYLNSSKNKPTTMTFVVK